MNKHYDFEQAKALYGLGKSSRMIEEMTGIPHATVIRKANADKWVKGDLLPLVRSLVRLVEDLRRLTPVELDAVLSAVDLECRKKGIKDFGFNRWIRRLVSANYCAL